jgi:hypothetical protein
MTIIEPFIDQYLRGRADRHKPIYRELREEGVSQNAIELLHEGRDMLELRWSPYGFAQWFNVIAHGGARPLTEADVWPHGRPGMIPPVDPFDPSPRMHSEWDQLGAAQAADWDALESSWVAEWAAADAPDVHKAAAELWWENQL